VLRNAAQRRFSRPAPVPVPVPVPVPARHLAEGAEFSRDEKQRFYRMARRSATETAAILDILDRRQAVAASVLAPALELLERVVAMLARLAGA
jgi:four helix bundle protein